MKQSRNMTAGRLIELLEEYPRDAEVLFSYDPGKYIPYINTTPVQVIEEQSGLDIVIFEVEDFTPRR